MKLINIIFTLTVLSFPALCIAEVSDKIILPPRMFLYAFILSLIAILFNTYKVKLSPLVMMLTLGMAAGGLLVVYDKNIGHAAILEQGIAYKYYAYGEFIVVFIANIVGIYFGFKRAKAT